MSPTLDDNSPSWWDNSPKQGPKTIKTRRRRNTVFLIGLPVLNSLEEGILAQKKKIFAKREKKKKKVRKKKNTLNCVPRELLKKRKDFWMSCEKISFSF